VGNDPRRSRARDDRHDSRGVRDDDLARIHRKIDPRERRDRRAMDETNSRDADKSRRARG